jgi:predicted adenylyl cyclase CyaB
MPRNIEIKARIRSVDALMTLAAHIADEGPIEINQDDTFFRCDTGRLKLREFTGDSGELIFYKRDDTSGPKESFYIRAPTSEPVTLRECLTLAYGQVGRVRKQRTLFLVGRARIHIDRVADLGDFMEIEVVLEDGAPIESGVSEAHDLMRRLGVESSQLVQGAYVDLIPRTR